MKQQTLFLEFLLKGIANLYYLKRANSEHFFYERDGEVIELENNIEEMVVEGKTLIRERAEYRNYLRHYFRDSPVLFGAIDNSSLTQKSMVRLFESYHNNVCDEFECVDYTRSIRDRLFIEPQLGLVQSTMLLQTSNDKSTSQSWSVGANVLFQSAKIFKRWSLYTGVAFAWDDFDGRFSHNLLQVKEHRIKTSYTVIRVPLEARFRMTSGTNRLYLDFGSGLWFLANKILEETGYRILKDSDITIERHQVVEARKVHTGIQGGLSISRKMSANMEGLLRLNVEYNFPVIQTGRLSDFHRILSSQLIGSVKF